MPELEQTVGASVEETGGMDTAAAEDDGAIVAGNDEE